VRLGVTGAGEVGFECARARTRIDKGESSAASSNRGRLEARPRGTCACACGER
jgi:hypothetical protein